MISFARLIYDRRKALKKNSQWLHEKITHPDSVQSLTVLPLVDFYSSHPDAKTEAGVSYLIRADDFTLLLDVGYNMKREHPSPLLSNMKLFGVELSSLDALYITHPHLDHLGGAEDQLRRTFSLSKGSIDFPPLPVYTPVPLRPSRYNRNPGSRVEILDRPARLAQGVYSIGSIARALYLIGYVEEQALAVKVAGKGLVLIVGCGHQTARGVIDRARELFDEPIYGIIGGLHLPVHGGRLMKGPLNLQAIVGTDSFPCHGITEQDVSDAITAIREAKISMVSLSAHDSSDWAINRFREAFGAGYRELQVGLPITV